MNKRRGSVDIAAAGTPFKIPVAEPQMMDMWKEPHIYKQLLLPRK